MAILLIASSDSRPGKPSTGWQALQKVVEALTTAGFGGHVSWTTPQLNLLVLGMNITGITTEIELPPDM